MSADQDGKLLVRYKNETFDLTKFAAKHPGGRNTLSGVVNSDIDYKFETTMPHSQAAKYLLKEYRVPNQTNNNNSQFDSKILHEESKRDESNADERMDSEHLIKTDDSMEVNWWCSFKILDTSYSFVYRP